MNIKKHVLVSIGIPTKNSSMHLDACLSSIKKQSYQYIEIYLIDSGSTDDTLDIAKKYHIDVYQYYPKVKQGLFETPYKRNYGAKRANGKYYYYLDADMILTKNNVSEAVNLCESQGYDGIILSEDSFGEGIWAQAKNLERRCYWGDDTIEAPRFIRLSTWKKIGGMDVNVGGGGDDWDLYQKLLSNGYRVGRTKSIVLHNEGKLSIWHLMKKRYMYGKQTLSYIQKRPSAGIISYFPIRKAYLKNWKVFLHRPKDFVAFIIMRTAEYSAGFFGIVTSLLQNE